MKVKYKDQVIEVCEGALFEVVGGNLVITPKEQEFKDGDILVFKDERDCVFIFNSSGKYTKSYYIARWDGKKLDIEGNLRALALDGNHDVDYATEEEKQTLFDTLEKYGKKWNPETKQIEDILKVGDLAIFWDDDKKDACISTYTELKYPRCTPGGFNYASTIKDGEDYICWKNAIKCTSLEQYINFKK